MPQAKAIAFIKREESFDRRFYAGYVGPVNQNGKTNLYVNLRCLEVRDTQIIFYAGCGVTADSQPAREWQESERKIDILKSLI
jgi:isochorismate synthase